MGRPHFLARDETTLGFSMDIEIWGKDNCVFCIAAVELCKKKNLEYTYKTSIRIKLTKWITPKKKY
jgi:glutaredoxin